MSKVLMFVVIALVVLAVVVFVARDNVDLAPSSKKIINSPSSKPIAPIPGFVETFSGSTYRTTLDLANYYALSLGSNEGSTQEKFATELTKKR